MSPSRSARGRFRVGRRLYTTAWLSAQILVALTTAHWAAAAPPPAADWPNVGNDKAGTRHSLLDQINRDTVAGLKVAWTYKVDDADPARNTTIECTPVVVDGVMYVTTVRTKVVALDAATGRELWRFDPYGPAFGGPENKAFVRASGGVNRGVAYWSDGRPGGQRRVLLGASDGRLVSLDAKTGKPDPAFGDGGVVDLKAGIAERDVRKEPYGPTSAPAVLDDVVIVGCSNGEGHPAAPGDPRAFDVRTGRELWRFHTIPRPGEPGSETWESPDYWRNRGGANPWGGFTVDVDAGIVFMGTGSAGPDFYGAGRKGANLYANCVLALDARTGTHLWHFQTTHHDLWDHDNPCPPVLCHVTRDGRRVEAVAQVTKTGYCYILDRKTGRPLFEVKETPAEPSDTPGEQAHPTQPVPVKPPPLARTRFTEADVTERTPEARRAVLERLKTLKHGGHADPPAVAGSVVVPGFHGGATWAGASFDPASGLLYVNTNNNPYVQGLKKRDDGAYDGVGYNYFSDPDGYPAMKPPWGLLTAVDVSKGEFAWQVPLGEFPELAAEGLRDTGTENFGGTIVTAGGLVFIGGSKDAKFRAFDAATGKVLWEHQLPAGGYATPCTYAAGGRQYVVIAAGGGGKPRTKSGDSFVAFALPGPPAAPAAPVRAAAPPAPRPAFTPTAAYRTDAVEGWTVKVHPDLAADADACRRVLDHLRADLFQARRVLPAAAAEKLRAVTIWAELNDPHHPGLVYHPAAGWLREHGMNPDKARCVELANASNYLAWTRRDQPYAVLHELAHAWHHQHVPGGYGSEQVRAAYRSARAGGRYDATLHIGGTRKRAYALNNPQEYFAELSEAYFGTNDFFPFVRAELKEHDPVGLEMIRAAWEGER